jgi:hypothetical protein
VFGCPNDGFGGGFTHAGDVSFPPLTAHGDLQNCSFANEMRQLPYFFNCFLATENQYLLIVMGCATLSSIPRNLFITAAVSKAKQPKQSTMTPRTKKDREFPRIGLLAKLPFVHFSLSCRTRTGLAVPFPMFHIVAVKKL